MISVKAADFRRFFLVMSDIVVKFLFISLIEILYCYIVLKLNQ